MVDKKKNKDDDVEIKFKDLNIVSINAYANGCLSIQLSTGDRKVNHKMLLDDAVGAILYLSGKLDFSKFPDKSQCDNDNEVAYD